MTHTASVREKIILLINGIEHNVYGKDVFLPLAQYLRNKVNLPGTKIVCSEGDCGACTVLVAKWKADSWSEFQTINSCIAPVFLFDLASIVTVEGLSDEGQMNEVQNKMREFHGAQCGYCTPGIVCSLSGLAEECFNSQTAMTEKKARNHLTGNLCRCTGYQPIIEAAVNVDIKKWQPLKNRYLTEDHKVKFKKLVHDFVVCEDGEQKVFIPINLTKALEFKSKNIYTKIISGSTDIGVLSNKGKINLNQILVLNRIPEIDKIENRENDLWIGAKISLTEFENTVENFFPEFSRLIRVFASPQIKNQGTLIGNILNGSPIGDCIPGLLALDAKIHLASIKGVREVALTDFYKGYKQLNLVPEEIALGISIPHLTSNYLTKFYKVSLRKDLDISAVTFAAALKVEEGKIAEARFAMGGVGPCVHRLYDIEKQMVGKEFSEENFKQAGQNISQHIKPISDLRATEQYRLKVAENLFHKCYFEIAQEEKICP
ncbi:MAG: FAD binding domain-containing protein [Bdellovibrio sp.]